MCSSFSPAVQDLGASSMSCATEIQCQNGTKDSGPRCPIIAKMKHSDTTACRTKPSCGCSKFGVKINGYSKDCCVRGSDICSQKKLSPRSDCSTCPRKGITPKTSPSTRNISNLSNVPLSASSVAGEEREKKLDLRGLIDSVGTMLIPVVCIVYSWSYQ